LICDQETIHKVVKTIHKVVKTIHKVVKTIHKVVKTIHKVEELLVDFSVKKVLAYYIDILPKV